MWTKWLLLAALLVGIESLHNGWVLIWFTAGALAAAAVATILPHAVLLQLGIFVVGSVALLVGARPIAYHLLFKRHAGVVTNVAAIIGREELCIQDINSETGRGVVRVYGTPWHASSARPGVEIVAGQRVKIVELRDLELVVEPVSVPATAAQDEPT